MSDINIIWGPDLDLPEVSPWLQMQAARPEQGEMAMIKTDADDILRLWVEDTYDRDDLWYVLPAGLVTEGEYGVLISDVRDDNTVVYRAFTRNLFCFLEYCWLTSEPHIDLYDLRAIGIAFNQAYLISGGSPFAEYYDKYLEYMVKVSHS